MYVETESIQWYDSYLLFPECPLLDELQEQHAAAAEGPSENSSVRPLSGAGAGKSSWNDSTNNRNSRGDSHCSSTAFPREIRRAVTPAMGGRRRVRSQLQGDLLERLTRHTFSSAVENNYSTALLVESLRRGQLEKGGPLSREDLSRLKKEEIQGRSKHQLSWMLSGEQIATDLDGADLDVDRESREQTMAPSNGLGGLSGGGAASGTKISAPSKPLQSAFAELPSHLGIDIEPVLCPFHTETEALTHVATAAGIYAVVTSSTPSQLFFFDQLNAIPISSFVLSGCEYHQGVDILTHGAESAAATRRGSGTATAQGPMPLPSDFHGAAALLPCHIEVTDTVVQLWLDPSGHFCIVSFHSGKSLFFYIPQRSHSAALPPTSEVSGVAETAKDEQYKRRRASHQQWKASALQWLRGGGGRHRKQRDTTETDSDAPGAEVRKEEEACQPSSYSLTICVEPPTLDSSNADGHGTSCVVRGTKTSFSSIASVAWNQSLSQPPSLNAAPSSVALSGDVLLGTKCGGWLLACQLSPTGAIDLRVVYRFPSPMCRTPIDSMAYVVWDEAPGNSTTDGEPEARQHQQQQQQQQSLPVPLRSDLAEMKGGDGVGNFPTSAPLLRSSAPLLAPPHRFHPHFLSADDEYSTKRADGGVADGQCNNWRSASLEGSRTSPLPACPSPLFPSYHPNRFPRRQRWVVLVSVRNRLYVFSSPSAQSLLSSAADRPRLSSLHQLYPNIDAAFPPVHPSTTTASPTGRAASLAHPLPSPTNYITIESAALSARQCASSLQRSSSSVPPSFSSQTCNKHSSTCATPPAATAESDGCSFAYPSAPPFENLTCHGQIQLVLPPLSPAAAMHHDSLGTPARLPPIFYWRVGDALVQGLVLCGGGLDIGSKVASLLNTADNPDSESCCCVGSGDGTLQRRCELHGCFEEFCTAAMETTKDYEGVRSTASPLVGSHLRRSGAAVLPSSRLLPGPFTAPTAGSPRGVTQPSSVLPVALLSVVNLTSCVQSLHKLLSLTPAAAASADNQRTGAEAASVPVSSTASLHQRGVAWERCLPHEREEAVMMMAADAPMDAALARGDITASLLTQLRAAATAAAHPPTALCCFSRSVAQSTAAAAAAATLTTADGQLLPGSCEAPLSSSSSASAHLKTKDVAGSLEASGEHCINVAAHYTHWMLTTTRGVYVFAHLAVLPLLEAAVAWRRSLVYYKAAVSPSSTATPAPWMALADTGTDGVMYIANLQRMIRFAMPALSTSAAAREQAVLQLLSAAQPRVTAGRAAKTEGNSAALPSVVMAASNIEKFEQRLKNWTLARASAETRTYFYRAAQPAAATTTATTLSVPESTSHMFGSSSQYDLAPSSSSSSSVTSAPSPPGGTTAPTAAAAPSGAGGGSIGHYFMHRRQRMQRCGPCPSAASCGIQGEKSRDYRHSFTASISTPPPGTDFLNSGATTDGASVGRRGGGGGGGLTGEESRTAEGSVIDHWDSVDSFIARNPLLFLWMMPPATAARVRGTCARLTRDGPLLSGQAQNIPGFGLLPGSIGLQPVPRVSSLATASLALHTPVGHSYFSPDHLFEMMLQIATIPSVSTATPATTMTTSTADEKSDTAQLLGMVRHGYGHYLLSQGRLCEAAVQFGKTIHGPVPTATILLELLHIFRRCRTLVPLQLFLLLRLRSLEVSTGGLDRHIPEASVLVGWLVSVLVEQCSAVRSSLPESTGGFSDVLQGDGRQLGRVANATAHDLGLARQSVGANYTREAWICRRYHVNDPAALLIDVLHRYRSLMQWSSLQRTLDRLAASPEVVAISELQGRPDVAISALILRCQNYFAGVARMEAVLTDPHAVLPSTAALLTELVRSSGSTTAATAASPSPVLQHSEEGLPLMRLHFPGSSAIRKKSGDDPDGAALTDMQAGAESPSLPTPTPEAQQNLMLQWRGFAPLLMSCYPSRFIQQGLLVMHRYHSGGAVGWGGGAQLHAPACSLTPLEPKRLLPAMLPYRKAWNESTFEANEEAVVVLRAYSECKNIAVPPVSTVLLSSGAPLPTSGGEDSSGGKGLLRSSSPAESATATIALQPSSSSSSRKTTVTVGLQNTSTRTGVGVDGSTAPSLAMVVLESSALQERHTPATMSQDQLGEQDISIDTSVDTGSSSLPTTQLALPHESRCSTRGAGEAETATAADDDGGRAAIADAESSLAPSSPHLSRPNWVGITPHLTEAAVQKVLRHSGQPLGRSKAWKTGSDHPERDESSLLQPVGENAVLVFLQAVIDGGLLQTDASLLTTYVSFLLRDGDIEQLHDFTERVALQYRKELDVSFTAQWSMRYRPSAPTSATAVATAAFSVPLQIFRLCACHRCWIGCVWMLYALGSTAQAVDLALHIVGRGEGVQLAIRLLRHVQQRDQRLDQLFSTADSVNEAAFWGQRASRVRRELRGQIASHFMGEQRTASRRSAEAILQLRMNGGGDGVDMTEALLPLLNAGDVHDGALMDQLRCSLDALSSTRWERRRNIAALGRDASLLKRELMSMADVPMVLHGDERCGLCGQPALARPFLSYPRCRHLLHVACYESHCDEEQRGSHGKPRAAALSVSGPSTDAGVRECLLCSHRYLKYIWEVPLWSVGPVLGAASPQPRVHLL